MIDNKVYSNRYCMSEKDIAAAWSQKDLYALAEKVTKDNKPSDDQKLHEGICSFISRQPNRGIITELCTVKENGYCTNIGNRSMVNVIDDLEYRIKDAGLEPEEYMISHSDRLPEAMKKTGWKPTDVNDSLNRCNYVFETDFGGSEGIYFDLYVDIWAPNVRRQRYQLLTCKTLDDDVEAFFRMYKLEAFCKLLLVSDSNYIRKLDQFLERSKNDV